MSSNPHNQDPDQKPSVPQLIGSVLSAAVGIRSSKSRDFKHGKVSTFVIAGVIYVALFIGTVYSVVRLVLSHAGH